MERNKNANDWRSQLDPKVRTEVPVIIAQWLKEYYPNDDEGMIYNVASNFAERVCTEAKDENDYIQKLIQKVLDVDKEMKKLQLASINRTNTQDSAQVVMEAPLLPTSLSYTQTPTSQPWLQQNTLTNLNVSRSSGLPSQVPILDSMAENVNSHVGRGVQINPLHSSQRQRQEMGQQHGNLLSQQQYQQKRLSKQPIQQSFPQSSNQHTSMQQDNPLLLRQQFPVQGVHSSHQQQMAVLSEDRNRQQRENLISQLMNVQKQLQNRSLPKHLDSDIQRFQAASSFRQNQNIAELQNQPHQLQRAPLANPSIQDSSRTTVNVTVGDWKEETYQKIKALKVKHFPILSAMLQHVDQKLMQNVSPESFQPRGTQNLNKMKWCLKIFIDYLNVERSRISEKHRDLFSRVEQKLSSMTAMFRSTMQQEQRQIQSQQTHQTTLQSKGPQVHVLQSLKKDQINSGLMTSNQIGASSSVSGLNPTSQIMKTHSMRTRPMSEPRDQNNNMASSRNVMVPSPASNLQAVHSLNSVQSSMSNLQALPSPGSNLQAVHSLNSVQSSMSNLHALSSPGSNLQAVHSLNSVQPSMIQQQEKQFHYGQMQQPQEGNQQVQVLTSHQTNERNDVETGLLQQPLLLSRNQLLSSKHQLPNSLSNDSPLASSPKIQDYSSSQFMDQQTTLNQTITTCGSPIVDLSSIFEDIENFISFESPVSDAQSLDSSVKLDTPEQTPFTDPPAVKLVTPDQPPFTDPPEAITEQPIDRLLRTVQSVSQKSFAESVSEMSSVRTMADRIAGSFHPNGGSQAGLREDLSDTTNFCLQNRNIMTDAETNQTKRLKHSISTLPRDITSQSDSFNHFSSLESAFDSITSSCSNANKIESGSVLLQEIREINGRFVETVVEICSEDSSGTIVKCSYTPVALCDTIKDHYYNSGKISQIQPLRVLVPASYPSSGPILLEELPSESSVHKHEDLWSRTKLRFSISMKEHSEAVSLKQIAQTWNDSARATMLEYAQRYSGSDFSSKYGVWRNIV